MTAQTTPAVDHYNRNKQIRLAQYLYCEKYRCYGEIVSLQSHKRGSLGRAQTPSQQNASRNCVWSRASCRHIEGDQIPQQTLLEASYNRGAHLNTEQAALRLQEALQLNRQPCWSWTRKNFQLHDSQHVSADLPRCRWQLSPPWHRITLQGPSSQCSHVRGLGSRLALGSPMYNCDYSSTVICFRHIYCCYIPVLCYFYCGIFINLFRASWKALLPINIGIPRTCSAETSGSSPCC